MKFSFNHFSIYICVLFLSLASCKKEDDVVSGTGNISLEFENGFGGVGDIVLNTTTQTTSSNQRQQYSNVKYIVSNIVLIQADGTELKYQYNNPDQGAFIIDQSDAIGGICAISLTDIPAANYTKVRFGLGISKDAYVLGQAGQADFFTKANAKGMFWTWAAGYIFVKLEGQYGAQTLDGNFVHHLGKKMSIVSNPDLYKEITLDLPTSAKVRSTISPVIHLMVDFNKHLSGDTPIVLDDTTQENMSGTGIAVDIMNNLTKAFSVEHVHND